MKTTHLLGAAFALGAGFVTNFAARADILYATDPGATWKFSSSGVRSNYAFNGLIFPTSLAFNSAGILYGGISRANSVVPILHVGRDYGQDSLLRLPHSIAFDRNDNLYVTTGFDQSTIIKYAANGGGSIFASGLNGPMGLAFDIEGNLYVASNGDNTIVKFTPEGVASIFASIGLSGPNALAFDIAGNLYVSNNYGPIVRFTRSGVGSIFSPTLGSGLLSSLAFDSSGNLYLGQEYNISKFTPDGVRSTFADISQISAPYGLAFTDDTGVPLPLPIGRAVPEPSAAALLAFGTLFAGLRRRRSA